MRSGIIALWFAVASTPAWAQAPFYEGKTVTVVIGASGGSLEIAARIAARHLGKHLPGNPNVIVQNMTGAAHLVATNHVYNVAKPDGPDASRGESERGHRAAHESGGRALRPAALPVARIDRRRRGRALGAR